MRQTINSNGYSTLFAGTADEALKKAWAVRPDIIIVDLMTPEKGGAQFYYDLKQDSRLKDVSVLILSSVAPKTSFQYQKIGLSLPEVVIPDPDAFLEKPPEAEDLLHWVHRLAPMGPTDPEKHL